MRIGLVVPGFSADEQDWCIPVLRHTARELARGDDVRVLTLRYPYRAAEYTVHGARVTALGGGVARDLATLGLWRRALATLAAMHRREPFDVLHALWATEPGMLAAVAGRLLGIPVVVGIAGGELVALRDAGYGGQLARDDRVKSRVALRLADVVTGGSRYMCELAAPWAAALPLPLGIDTELFAPEPGGLSDPPRLVHAGSLVPVKDQATLLRALAALRERGVAFSAELAGEGYLEPELRALAESLGLAEHVRFLGALPHHELPAFYRGAAAFVLSSLHEAQCMAVLEAAACGVPTVGTAVGVAPELAPEAALTVPPRDPAALAAALHTLLRDDRRRAAMGLAALGIARGEYALECFAARARTVYAEARRRRGLLPQRPQSAPS